VAIPGTIQVATDDFNRANQNPITGNWTDSGSGNAITLASNAVTPGALGNDADAIWNVWASGNDHYSQGQLTTTGTSAGSGLGVCVRHSPTAGTKTYYRFYMDGAGNWELDRFIAGAFASLQTGSTSYVGGTAIGLLVIGTTISCWYGGVQVGTNQTDSNITTGVPGIAYSSTVTTATLDNWDAGIPSQGFLFRNVLRPYVFQPQALKTP
jgi:hypothetical protein